MEPNNYEPDNWEIGDETFGSLDLSEIYENDSTQFDSDDALEMGDFVWEAFDAAVNPNYSDS